MKSMRLAIFLTCLLWQAAGAAGSLDPESYYGNYNPEHLSAVERHHLQKARDKAHWENPAYAWNDVDFILRHFPNHPEALMLVINASLRNNDRAKGEEFMRRAVSFDLKPAEPWIIYGIFLHRWGDYIGAVEKYQEALKRNPDHPEAWYNLGLAHFALKQYDKAEEAARKAYALGYPLPGLREKLRRVGHWDGSQPQ